MPTQKTLLLVDGSSYLYRAYFALAKANLRNAQGEPTGAIFGVLKMLNRLIQDYKPDYLACVFDAPHGSFREVLYPAYKAQRGPMPDELISQIAPLHQIIQGYGWPLLCVPEVEADDVIGTLAQQGISAGLQVIISTGDKDMVQLLHESVTLIDTLKNEILTVRSATEKYGIRPDQFIDYLTLIGDSSDNVRGVEKVGPKTAVKWLQHYQNLDNLIAHQQELTGMVGENLRKAIPHLPLTKKILTIVLDVPLTLHLEDLVLHPTPPTQLIPLIERYGLKKLLPIPNQEQEAESNVSWPSPIIVQDVITLLTQISTQPHDKPYALMPWASSKDPQEAYLVGLAMVTPTEQCYYFPLHHDGIDSPNLNRENFQALSSWLEDSAVRKIGHDLKTLHHLFHKEHINYQGWIGDTLLESYIIEAHLSHEISALAQRHLQHTTMTPESFLGKGAKQIAPSNAPLTSVSQYTGEQALVLWRTHQILQSILNNSPTYHSLYTTIELPLQEVLWRMEVTGVLLNASLLNQHSHTLGAELLILEDKAQLIVQHPFNLNSSKQIQQILYEEQGLPVLKKTPKGAPSTDEEVLQELALDHILPAILLQYRSLSKLKSTYTDALPRAISPGTGRIHTHFGQAVAVTGRLSSQDPNLQNIPIRTAQGRMIRQAFIAPPQYVLISADYSQIELRLMAHFSGDPTLISAFHNNEDIHQRTAAEIFHCPTENVTKEQRRFAKAINFGLIYGMSAFGLAKQLKIERSAAQNYMDRYFDRYPLVAQFMEKTRDQARLHGYVETLFGRRLVLPELTHTLSRMRQGAERAAINAPLQGSAADLIKKAMCSVQQWLDQNKCQSRLILQVHDELLIEAPQTEQDIIQQHLPKLMEEVALLKVPLRVEIGVGNNWDAAHL